MSFNRGSLPGSSRKGKAPYQVTLVTDWGGVALFGVSARNERKLGFALDRFSAVLDAVPGELAVDAVPGKRKRRAARRALPPLPAREPDPRYSCTRYVPAPEWTAENERALAARLAAGSAA